MPIQLTSKATATYKFGQQTGKSVSNTATTTIQGPLSVSKSSLDTVYKPGDKLTYMFNFTNVGNGVMTNIEISDDLGTYTIAEGIRVTPLTYLNTAQLFINGMQSSSLGITTDKDNVKFTIPALPSAAAAIIVYKAQVNEYASQVWDSSIVNTATVTAEGVDGQLRATHIVNVDSFVDVHIIKSIIPNPIMTSDTLSYVFDIYNYGNDDATSVILSDTFVPKLENISISVNDSGMLDSSQYTYIGGALTLPNSEMGLTITVPAGTFTQDTMTGEVSVEPGVTTITVRGIVL